MATEANIPSARRGIKLIDTVKAAGFDTLNEFQEFLAARGKPMIGTKGGEESLELLNSMVGQKDQYVKMYPEYVEMEEKTLRTSNPKKLKNIRSAKPASKLADEFDMDDMSYKPLNLSEEQLLKRAMDSLLANREKKFMKDGGLAEATAKLKAKGFSEGGAVVKDKTVAIDKSPNSGLITQRGFGASRKT